MLSAEAFREDPESLVCVAVLVYAAYTSTNKVRMTGAIPLSHNVACELLKQNCRNAVMGHCGSSRVIDARWCVGDASRSRLA